MTRRIISLIKGNVVACIAVFLALGGGGFALAATTQSSAVNACASKKSGQLSIRKGSKCAKGTRGVSWAKQGPKGATGPVGPAGTTGPAGPTGATGPAGTAVQTFSAQLPPGGGSLAAATGLSLQRTGTGEYTVTVIAPLCANEVNSLVVSVSNGNPLTGAFPYAWVEDVSGSQFKLHIGMVSSGAFSSADEGFNMIDTCTPQVR